MAIRIFSVMLFFAAVVLEPLNNHFDPGDPNTNSTGSYLSRHFRFPQPVSYQYTGEAHISFEGDDDNFPFPPDWDNSKPYLWAYVVFVYFFTALTLWYMNSETFRVIQTRQDYLGTQSTITDRTFRLSRIPKELRSEAKIKELVQRLEIGMVETVSLCRQWKELDGLVGERASLLQKLEEIWSVYLGQKPVRALAQGSGAAVGDNAPNADEEAGENGGLLQGEGGTPPPAERPRPQARIRYGPLRLRSRKTDAIDYYEEKLRRVDDKIRIARKKDYAASDLAFVTMDSIAACQMAIQALLDPRPGRLLTKLAPAPSDVVWKNTYTAPASRRLRSWLITAFVAALSVVWLVPVASIASLLSLCTISKWSPDLAESLRRHDITKALFQTGLPTATVSLLNVAVPYLYDFLSNYQGMLSQGDVELSIISKNFFFTFFNIFITFTIFGAATGFWTVVRDSLKDTTYVAYALAHEVQRLSIFYLNFIMLQGIGLFPFRLLQFGSVAVYPVYRMGAKTPRDFAQIMTPPVFQFGFYLPTALLVFILCLVYSVLPRGYLVLFFGLIYFMLGYFTYKYQLLYAMDQPLHATGGAWRLICYRILLGLGVLHLTMAGYLGALKAYAQAVVVIPALIFTVWYSFYFGRRFDPLTRFISLRSIRRDVDLDDDPEGERDISDTQARQQPLRRKGSTVDEDREKGLRFVNPSLFVPYVDPAFFPRANSVANGTNIVLNSHGSIRIRRQLLTKAKKTAKQTTAKKSTEAVGTGIIPPERAARRRTQTMLGAATPARSVLEIPMFGEIEMGSGVQRHPWHTMMGSEIGRIKICSWNTHS